jgi:adenosine deaminase
VTVTRELLRRLPKAELHVHLDGCLRPTTLLELARDAGVRLPAESPDDLAKAMSVERARNLEEYLERYRYTVSVLQTPQALERVAYEFVVDVAQENIRYVEVRYCPALHTPGVTLTQAVESPLAGIKRAQEETGCIVGVIICGLRTLSPTISNDLAHLAVDYREAGVVGFDLAGVEFGYPAGNHAAAFRYAAGHGLACTCHAGEGAGPESVRQALHECGAARIGHGTRIGEDPALLDYVAEHRIPLEVCLSSNVHTNTVRDIAEHPAKAYFDHGCVLTLNTDGRLIDGVTLTDEYWLAHTELGFTRADLEQVIVNTFSSAFLPSDAKASLMSRVHIELRSIP